jgi:hypothetical protein
MGIIMRLTMRMQTMNIAIIRVGALTKDTLQGAKDKGRW